MSLEQKPKKSKSPNKYLRFTGIAFQMGGTILLGNYFGKWLDEKYATDYWEQVVTLFSVFVAMYLIIAQVIKLSKDDD
ncbi:AtpZ/AtpI family protein [Winogradskyella litorisediminis]|uniref:AtpZ/AtpI family protein n=1 Tax=Winogradskyella litorisediminis TaxID=1156618 RepID=A0ABW3N4D1_9FLAO